MNEESFEGKVAVVTGAGKGLGRAAADGLVALGVFVGGLDVDQDALKDLADTHGDMVMAQVCDVRDAGQVRSSIDRLVAERGSLSYLVNAAGVVRYGTAPEFSEQDWDFVVDTNLKGAFLTIKYSLPHMLDAGSGSIVTIASVQAWVTQPTVAAYAASKGGLVAMTRSIALDHALQGIRINCVAPGTVRTPLTMWAAEKFVPDDPVGAVESWGRSHPIGRIIEPEEVAEAIIFLLSDRASAITGETLLVDGGLSGKAAV